MAQKTKSLSTSEFSKLTGILVLTVGKLIREGKIKGKKASGKWKIAESQLKAKAVIELTQVGKQKPALTIDGDAKKPLLKHRDRFVGFLKNWRLWNSFPIGFKL